MDSIIQLIALTIGEGTEFRDLVMIILGVAAILAPGVGFLFTAWVRSESKASMLALQVSIAAQYAPRPELAALQQTLERIEQRLNDLTRDFDQTNGGGRWHRRQSDPPLARGGGDGRGSEREP